MDSSHVSLVYLKIDGRKLESFKCNRPHTIGLNIPTLHKVLKTAKNTDTLKLAVSDGGGDVLSVAMMNQERATHSEWDIKLLDLDEEQLTIPEHNSNLIVSMSSQEFQEIMKDFAAFADNVTISVDAQRITFGCKGDSVSCQKTLENSPPPEPERPKKPAKPARAAKPSKKSLKRLKRSKFVEDEAEESGEEEASEEEPSDDEEPEDPEEYSFTPAPSKQPAPDAGRIPIRITGTGGRQGGSESYSADYALKYLLLFSKAAYLSNAVDIFVHGSQYPIIFKYNVASFGELRMCLAPRLVDAEGDS